MKFVATLAALATAVAVDTGIDTEIDHVCIFDKEECEGKPKTCIQGTSVVVTTIKAEEEASEAEEDKERRLAEEGKTCVDGTAHVLRVFDADDEEKMTVTFALANSTYAAVTECTEVAAVEGPKIFAKGEGLFANDNCTFAAVALGTANVSAVTVVKAENASAQLTFADCDATTSANVWCVHSDGVIGFNGTDVANITECSAYNGTEAADNVDKFAINGTTIYLDKDCKIPADQAASATEVVKNLTSTSFTNTTLVACDGVTAGVCVDKDNVAHSFVPTVCDSQDVEHETCPEKATAAGNFFYVDLFDDNAAVVGVAAAVAAAAVVARF